MHFRKILIAVDESPESMKAAQCGFELAHALKAALAVLFVVDKGKEIVTTDLGITPQESRNALREQAMTTIDQFIRMYNGISEVFRFTPEGDPRKEILSTAAEWQADCLVMGTHAHGKLDMLFSGSVAEHCIRYSPIPVLLTPHSPPSN